MTRYEQGRRYEYKIKKQLEKEGRNVTRSAGSHGDFDLIAIRPVEDKNGVYREQHTHIPVKWSSHTNPMIKLIQLKTGRSAKRAKKTVEDSGLKNKYSGLYSVSVEVL